jgi:hypothetical protein
VVAQGAHGAAAQLVASDIAFGRLPSRRQPPESDITTKLFDKTLPVRALVQGRSTISHLDDELGRELAEVVVVGRVVVQQPLAVLHDALFDG